MAPLSLRLGAVLDTLEPDKKHAAGALRWVLPTAMAAASTRTSRRISCDKSQQPCSPGGSPRGIDHASPCHGRPVVTRGHGNRILS